MNLGVPQNAGNFLTSWVTISSSGKIPLHEVSLLMSAKDCTKMNTVKT
jgi:hypothetical protein